MSTIGQPLPNPPGGASKGPAPFARPVGAPDDDGRLFGAAAHAVSFVEGGLIGPLAVYLLKKDESEFVAFHALQSLYFGIAFFVVTVLTCGLGTLILIWPYMIYEAIAALRAYEGEWYELPIVGRRARAKHPGPLAAPPP